MAVGGAARKYLAACPRGGNRGAESDSVSATPTPFGVPSAADADEAAQGLVSPDGSPSSRPLGDGNNHPSALR